MSVSLSDVAFVNLYLGDGFSDITGLEGSDQRRAVPQALSAGVQALRSRCEDRFRALGQAEFALAEGGVVYRVTTVVDFAGNPVFMIRKSAVKIKPVSGLGLPQPVVDNLLARGTGLVLIAGVSKAGKTTTASSLVVEWLKRHGGMGFCLEDPPETILQGLHGEGRCIQIPVDPVSRRDNGEEDHVGGYAQAMTLVRRGAASVIMIGETRDAATAACLIDASIGGDRVISTLHAASVIEAIQRLANHCPTKRSSLADGLHMVIHQELVPVRLAPSVPGGPGRQGTRVKLEVLDVSSHIGVKAKIRAGDFAALGQDIADQATRHAWNKQQQALRPAGEKR